MKPPKTLADPSSPLRALTISTLVALALCAAPAAAQGGLRLQQPGATGDTAPGLGVGSLRLGAEPAENIEEEEGGTIAPAPIEVELEDSVDDFLEEEFGDEPESGHDLIADGEHADGEHADGEHADGEHGAGAHEEGHHEAFDTTEFAATALNFVIWLAIIIFLLRKPLMAHLAERRRTVEEGLVEAARLEKEAKSKHADYSERLAHLDEELEKLRGEMVQAGEAEADRIIADAEERAARMRKDAEFRIAQQMKQLRADLTNEAIEAAVSAAERVLTGAVSVPDQERLANEYLETLNTSMEEEVRA